MSEKIDHIAELQKRLYARDPESIPKRKYGILRPLKTDVNSTWGDTEIPKDKTVHHTNVRGYKRFFLFSLGFFAIALGLALFSIYKGAMTLSAKNVEVRILGNAFVGGGEELPIQVEISNTNSSDLMEAQLTLDYPKGALDTTGSDNMHVEKLIGTIGSGKTHSEAFSVVLYGEQGSIRDIKATLTYKLAGASSVFQKLQRFAVTISSSPIQLTVDGPTTTAPNQPFQLTMRNLFTGDAILEKTVVRTEYPNGFVFQSATPAPTSGNNVWSLGDLEQGTERVISVRGKIIGEEGDEKSFRIYIGTPQSDTDSRIGVTYNSALHTIKLSRPFISGIININGQTTDIAAVPIGTPIEGTIAWKNNSATSIANPVFVLNLSGTGIDPSSIDPGQGYYNQLERTITWSGETNGAISTLASGQEGEFPFTFKTLPNDTSDINLTLSVKGTVPEENYALQSIDNLDGRTIRFASHLQFAVASLYSVGPIKNIGPFPSHADQETTYTVTWTARPSEHPVSQMTATTTLPPGVLWTGTIAPQAEQVVYNPDTRTVVWNIGNLPKATSIPQSKSVSFQVKIRPTKDQVGNEVQLVGPTTITGTDATANVPLSITRSEVSTSLDSDPIYSPGKEKVLP